MEAGLLVKEKSSNDRYVGIGSSSGDGDDSSHITAVAVFSTAVAVCGAFTNGCAVSLSLTGIYSLVNMQLSWKTFS